MDDIERIIRLIGALDDLAQKSARGFVDFETYAAACDSHAGVIYDKRNMRIVLDCVCDEGHSDIVSYYDDVFSGLVMRVCEQDGEFYIDVEFPGGLTWIVIEDGRWRVGAY